MNTYYVFDSEKSFSKDILEYVDTSDKVFLTVVSKRFDFFDYKENEVFKNIITLMNIWSPNISKQKDYSDFILVPYITDLSMHTLDKKIVLISKNPKLFCLKEYFKNYLDITLVITPSIQFYKSAKYIAYLLKCSYDIAASILEGVIKNKQLDYSNIPSNLKTKLSKNLDLAREVITLSMDFKKEDIIECIKQSDVSYFYEKLRFYNVDVKNDSLKEVAHFLKKSDSLTDFREKLYSSNISLSLQKRAQVFDSVINNIL